MTLRTLLPALAAGALLVPLAGAADPSLPAPAAPDAATFHVHMGPKSLPVPLFNLGFDPPVLEIHVGDTVEFHSHAATGHTATTGYTPGDGVATSLVPGAFDTGLVRSPDTVSVTFLAPGVLPYYCQVGLHAASGMRGVIKVLP